MGGSRGTSDAGYSPAPCRRACGDRRDSARRWSGAGLEDDVGHERNELGSSAYGARRPWQLRLEYRTPDVPGNDIVPNRFPRVAPAQGSSSAGSFAGVRLAGGEGRELLQGGVLPATGAGVRGVAGESATCPPIALDVPGPTAPLATGRVRLAGAARVRSQKQGPLRGSGHAQRLGLPGIASAEAQREPKPPATVAAVIATIAKSSLKLRCLR
jgi:hypothetical protein